MSIDWIIHYVSNGGGCACCGDAKNPSYYSLPGFANVHTHGLTAHGQRELCIVLDIGFERAGGVLNAMGVRVASGATTFEEGVRNDILGNGMPVGVISIKGDPTLYLMLPDPNGYLPGDSRCEEPYSLQEAYAKLISEHEDYV